MYKVIIDCDTGIDDSIALLYALKREDVQIMAITAGFGNCSAQQSAQNSLKMIELAKVKYHIPVYIGSEKTYSGTKPTYATNVHGTNGIGDVELPLSKQQPETEKADDAIIRIIHENPHEIILITLGRMTNLAYALDKDKEIVNLTKKLVFMGGTILAAGNVGAFSEANIAGDALAAQKVLTAGFNSYQVGLDITQSTHLDRTHLNYLSANAKEENKEIASYINQAMVQYFHFNHQASEMIECCPVHDPLAVLIALEPQLADVTYRPCQVETAPGLTYGMIVADSRVNHFDAPLCGLCLKCDSEAAVNKLISIFCN
ncbi:MAG: nucleoside hydrolase [Erysipelotrichia bacterium]|nr:nucleoside hydrolase [Erysipelotrichia bacterium]